MPTPAERNALAFLAIILLLGAAVRVVGATRDTPPTPGEQLALTRQIAAVDSVRRTGRRSGIGRRPLLDSLWTQGPRADTPRVSRRRSRSGTNRLTDSRGISPEIPVDMDRAEEWEIEGLPRIGPSLARRIVASRDTLGPFGELENLRRVPGVGPSLLRTLAPMVTFSLPPRPSGVFDRVGRRDSTRFARRRLHPPTSP